MIQFLKRIFVGPILPMSEGHLTVRFHLIGGQTVIIHNVKEIETTRNNEGGFNSYEIVWHNGFKPPMFSLTLGHISAIEVLKG